ncbi:hypothetical protein DZC72_04750 [Maribacter algicola]|uniref:Fibronectin type-III domain-containing protein n=2 Tax=Maribacter algicola TaxID=2498892 RepID=A0A3R8R4M9_9FLAO|nr:hypothetical protein DZC72_04750 [Maribacter algicola]
MALVSLLLACDGEFVKNDLAIFLTSPKNDAPCLDGEKVGEKLDIPVEWTIEGLPNNLIIYVDKLDDNKEIIDISNQQQIPIAVEETSKKITVDPGSWYQWQIIGNEGNLKSDVYTFFSEGPPSPNQVPLPAQIQITRNSNSQVQFNWTQTPDLDNDRLVFDVFFGETEDTSIPLRENLESPEEISLSPIEADKTYYIKVITKEIRSDNTVGNRAIALLKVAVNG